MPMASEGKQLFPVSQTNSYGRIMIDKQMRTHDHLIQKAPTVVSDRVRPIYMKQMDILHKAERFRPSYNIMKQRHDDDIVMANLIRDAQCTCENQLDGHILRFRELRQKHPNHMPGWLEQYEVGKSMEIHEQVVKHARKWIDDEPPKRALHYREVLRKTPYTKGGFPRIMPVKGTRRKRRKKPKAAELLPERRSVMSRERTMAQSRTSFDGDAETSERGSPVPQGNKPHWALDPNDGGQGASPSPGRDGEDDQGYDEGEFEEEKE